MQIQYIDTTRSQVLNLGASAVTTSTAIPQASFRMISQVGCHILVGTGTASTSDFYVTAGVITPDIKCTVGQVVSVLNATATADAKVTIFY